MYSVVKKISTKFAVAIALGSVIAGGFSDNGIKSMLNLGLSLIRVVGAYDTYTEFVPWQVFQNCH